MPVFAPPSTSSAPRDRATKVPGRGKTAFNAYDADAAALDAAAAPAATDPNGAGGFGGGFGGGGLGGGGAGSPPGGRRMSSRPADDGFDD